MDRLYSNWISAGELSAGDAERLHSIVGRLAMIYRQHIRLEEEIVFPCAAKQLDRNAVAAMGAEFKARRG